MKVLLIGAFMVSVSCFAQSYRVLSTAKKMVAFHIGMANNRFLPSNFMMNGNYFNLRINNARFESVTSPFKLSQFFSSSMHVGMGWNVRKNLQVMVGLDNLKYQLTPQVLSITGSVKPNYDQLGGFSGSYQNTPVAMDTLGFTIEMTNVRFISLQLNRLVPLIHSRNYIFAVVGTYGAGLGALNSEYNFNFGPSKQEQLSSLSGIGGFMNFGVRLEFFGRVYLLPSLSGGLLVQKNLRMNLSEANQTAKQQLWFGQANLSIGTTLFPGKRKNCDCPHF